MKTLIQRLLRENLLSEGVVTQSDLDSLESELDNVFRSIGIDIEFTNHFFDRVNDARNGRDITIEELRNIFKGVYSEYKNKLTKYGNGFTGVFKNPPTAINIPFVLSWDEKNQELDLVTKTVMRKKNFMSDTPILPVGSKNQPINEPKKKEPVFNIQGVKWVIDREKELFVKKNNREVTMPIDQVLDQLDEPSQERILSYL